MKKILVIGAGSWGTAFANYLSKINDEIRIWVREEEVIKSIKEKQINSLFLPDIRLCKNLRPVSDLRREVEESDILVFAVPSQFIGSVFEEIKDLVKNKILVNLSKGFDSQSLKTISQTAVSVFGESVLNQWLTLSGPSFAKELGLDHPTAIVGASVNEEISEKIQESFSSEILRIYRSTDLIGVEVAGSMKNVMALASGVIHGCGFGYNTTATLVTRASVEISRFGTGLGARKETFWGLAGIGDLMLTCFGTLSRNFQTGVRIAKGETLEHILKTTITVSEGVETSKAIYNLAGKLDIDMPITQEVYKVLYEGKAPGTAVKALMKRSLKKE